MSNAIDLLQPVPSLRVSRPVIEQALVFAFSSGDTAHAFERVLENACSWTSSWAPECFANDLFIDEFIDRCLPIRANGTRFTPCKPYLRRILTSPPRAIEDAAFRQAIFAELDGHPTHRAELESLYASLQELRTLLSRGDYSTRMDQNLRRFEILRSLAHIFRAMADGFAGARSGLARIREGGQRVVQGEPFQRLEELLEYERQKATVDIRVSLDLGGRIRAFEVLHHQANITNRFHSSWLTRLWKRFLLMLRGYHISHHEALTRLLDQTFEAIKPELATLFQLLGDLEYYLAGLGFADLCRGAGLTPSLPHLVAQHHGNLELAQLFNPFLVAEHIDVHPCDVSAAADGINIITGPNSGGKTRLLQSIALCQLLAQCGAMVPAARARIPWRNGLFVSLLDEVRADQHEGRLGMELLRIRRLFEQIDVGDLVVIDELCSGTNPSEGEEIFRLVVQLLSELEPQVWLSTHFLEFAERLRASSETASLRFLQVKLDAQEHPTFEFEEGVASTSLARQTASRLGVTREELTQLVAAAKTRHNRDSRSLRPAASS